METLTPKTKVRSEAGFVREKVGELEVMLAPRPGSGLTAAELYIRRGSADEGPEEIGLASFTASMLKRGTEARASAEIAFELESLGATAGHGAGLDAAHSSLRCATADFRAALAVFFDCLRRPTFDPGELEIERDSLLAYLKRLEDQKFDLTYREYIKRIFAGHGYGHAPEGEAEDVTKITQGRCRAWHAEVYRPRNMLFVAAGDFESDAMLGWLAEQVEDWRPAGVERPRCEQSSEGSGEQGVVEKVKQLEQGFVVMGYHVPPPTHTDYFALRIASAALGEGFAGRLFTNLRDRRSLAYAVGSALRSHRLGGHMMLYIGTQGERLDEAREGLAAEARALAEKELGEEDLARAQNYVAGKFVMGRQTLASRCAAMARWEDLGLGAEFDEQYVERLRTVTVEQVLQAAKRWWVRPSTVVLRPRS